MATRRQQEEHAASTRAAKRKPAGPGGAAIASGLVGAVPAANLSPAVIRNLQRTVGNRAVIHLLSASAEARPRSLHASHRSLPLASGNVLGQSAGNEAVPHALTIQRESAAAAQERKAEAGGVVDKVVRGGVRLAEDKAPELAAGAVQDEVAKGTQPELDRMASGSIDEVGLEDAKSAASSLADLAGTTAETVTRHLLDGETLGPALLASLEKRLALRGGVAPAPPSIDVENCTLRIGKPGLSGFGAKALSDPSKVGIKWQLLDGTCGVNGGGSLSLKGTLAVRGFLGPDFEPRLPISFSGRLELDYQSNIFGFGAYYQVAKDPKEPGQVGGLNVKFKF